MLRYLLTNGSDPKEYIIHLLLCLPVILLSLSIHEAAHGYISSKLGDPTAKNLGRLTLNPIKHLDPFGFISMLLFGFGWANPVPINTRYFKKPRRDMALSAAAGPLSNLLLAIIFAGLIKIFYLLLPTFASMINSQFGANLLGFSYAFLYYGVSLNVTLAVFNMLPCPPFDGSRILYVFLPTKYYFGVMKYERYIPIVIMVLLFTGILDPIINFFRSGVMNLIFMMFGLA